jgi:hypothetical protein
MNTHSGGGHFRCRTLGVVGSCLSCVTSSMAFTVRISRIRHVVTLALWCLMVRMLQEPATAAPPQRLEGLSYRDIISRAGLRSLEETMISLAADGSYATLVARRVETVSGTRQFSEGYGRGTYTSVQSSPGNWTVTLLPVDAAPVVLNLRFTHDETGTITRRDFQQNFDVEGRFWVSQRSITPLINVSARVPVVPGTPAIVGFVVRGTGPREVLIRAVGPGLKELGVERVWDDPEYNLYGERGPMNIYGYRPFVFRRSGDWDKTPGAETIAAFSQAVGAFPLKPGSKDAADVVRLDPGAYTVVLQPQPGASGEALIEVYVAD